MKFKDVLRHTYDEVTMFALREGVIAHPPPAESFNNSFVELRR